MKLTDIKSEEQLLQYIQGALNDMSCGFTSQDETEWLLIDLLTYLIKLDRENRGYKLASGKSKLPIA